jgi:hypothetical protein
MVRHEVFSYMQSFEGIIDIHAHASPDTTGRSLDVLVTNPMYWAINMSADQMKEAADLGAYIKFIYYSVGRPGATWTLEGYADAIKAIGPERCILSTCGGQAWMPVHTFAWSSLLAGMRKHGIAESAIALMTRTNPARLLGLE